ncbi:MAG: polysaccharide biosynthesis/export family protein [Alphaproteobacteria bacterium]
MVRVKHAVVTLFLMGLLAVCGVMATGARAQGLPPGVMPGASIEASYILGPGDRVRVIVFNETDLSGDFDVDGRGQISVPLIGEIQAGGGTVRQVERTIEEKLREGFLRDPKVSAQVIGYRPFFILGEVRAPGSYPYVNGMTIVSAVAIAGGYTPRANRREVVIIRAGREVKATEETVVLPGDTVRINERFF